MGCAEAGEKRAVSVENLDHRRGQQTVTVSLMLVMTAGMIQFENESFLSSSYIIVTHQDHIEFTGIYSMAFIQQQIYSVVHFRRKEGDTWGESDFSYKQCLHLNEDFHSKALVLVASLFDTPLIPCFTTKPDN